MKKIKRVFLIVLDSVGAGEAPDAAAFGDAGAHTLESVFKAGGANLPNLCKMGLGNIDGLGFFGATAAPTAAVARMQEKSLGKDTTIGHWELMGHIANAPLPTFPEGFPEDILDKVRRISGREILCNLPYSGTAVIADYGAESVKTGALIVYTSADSVLQIAAHTDIVPLEELYRICSELRKQLTSVEDGVGRIIARPFVGDAENGFKRTSDRRDYSLEPPRGLLPEILLKNGYASIALGKISDIFAGVGFNQAERTHGNTEGMELMSGYLAKDFNGLCFLNLVDFDMLYGHRRDADGYARALEEFDAWVGEAVKTLNDDDILLITADHGCDPCFEKTTDHTREYVPLLMYSPALAPENYGTRASFADVAATVASLLGVEFECGGSPIKLKFTE